MTRESIFVDGKKYEIVLTPDNNVEIYRYGELMERNPKYSKMFIALIYEMKELQQDYDAAKQWMSINGI